jgi:uridine phosphorylase
MLTQDRGAENIVIQPRRERGEEPLPENGLLLVNPGEATEWLGSLRQEGGVSRHLFHSRLVVAAGQGFFAAGPAIGAPMAAMTMEKLIALGAKRVVLCGWCGAVDPGLRLGDIVVPDLAVAGEGTSPYYPVPPPLRAHPGLRRQLLDLLREEDLLAHGGTLWSTDAPYREDRRQLALLHGEQGVVAVDMEYSALCAVAAFRQVGFAAVLVVSDHLAGPSWQPGFATPAFRRRTKTVLATMLRHAGRFQGE